jgi:uncharacterized protein DUF1996
LRKLLLVLLFALPAEAAAPGWIVSCSYSHSLSDDPIVFPNQPGASHLHDFAGSMGTRANSTIDQMRAAGTTCAIGGDTSGYWVPALYIHGSERLRVLPKAQGTKNALFYYRRKGAPSGTTVRAFPAGLKMVIGNGHAQTPAENPLLGTQITWKCGPGSGTDTPRPPAQCGSGTMVLSMTFPNCWNGRDLDSPDHISHMRYPSGSRCPTSHPVVLPRIESFWRYNVGTQPIGEVNLASGPDFTAHGDFMDAWIPTALQSLLNRCVNAGVDCGTNPQVP